jgi:enterobactin synthetase component D
MAHPAVPLPSGEWGAPVWPSGVVGSITHSAGIAAAVAIPASHARGVGIDAELIMSAKSAADVENRILPEMSVLARSSDLIGALSWTEFLTVVFSAKESIYKCLHPLCGVFFDFDAVQLESVDWRAGTMRFRLVQRLSRELESGVLLTADFRVEQRHVFTAVRIT